MNKKMLGAFAVLLALASGTAVAQVKPLELEEIAKPLAELRLPEALVANRFEQVEPGTFLAEDPEGLSIEYFPPAYDD